MRMKIAMWSVACAAALSSIPCVARSANANVLPQCTVIAVQIIDAVNSKTARPGDFFRFQTINSVDFNGHIVLAEHTTGWGIVTVATPAAKGGRAGSLVLEPLYFKTASGEKMGVVLDHNSSALQASGPSDSLPAYLGAIPVVGVGAAVGAFDYFHHGKDITVQKGTIFAVFPSDDPSVAGCRKSKKTP
jgi:hypothetical protein